MKITWDKIGTSGFQVSATNEKENLGYLYCWEDGEKLRINWVMTYKKHQNEGVGKALLEEVKKNYKEYFGKKCEGIIFKDVPSKGMARLIDDVFGGSQIYLTENFKGDMRNEMLKRTMALMNALPRKSPAKYNGDGSCSISRNAIKIDLFAKLR